MTYADVQGGSRISAPFGVADEDKKLSPEFLKNGIGDTNGTDAEIVDRHTMNGIGYMMSLALMMRERCLCPSSSMASAIHGYPKGAVKAKITEDGEYREFVCNGDNTMSEPPFSEPNPPNEIKNGWLATKGWWNTVFTPDYYYYRRHSIWSRSSLVSVARYDEEQHEKSVAITHGCWLHFQRRISLWDSLSLQQKRSRSPCCQAFIISESGQQCILNIPFFAGATVDKWIPVPENTTLKLVISSFDAGTPPAQDLGDIKGFGSIIFSADECPFDSPSHRADSALTGD